MQSRVLFLAIPVITLLGCPEAEEQEIPCPSGTVRQGGVCVRPDAGGDDEDGGIPPKDGGSDTDGGPTDGGQTDGGPFDAGAEAATISTLSLDFGGTLLGTTPSLSFTVENRTSAPVVVNTAAIGGPQADAFTYTSTPATNRTLSPNESITVTVAFTPAVEAAASASIVVQLCEGACEATVQLSGTGLVEAIDCAPAPVDFGFVNPGACATEQVDCTNLSAYDATIEDATLTGNSSMAFQVSGSTTTPVTLPGGGVFTLSVDYCPADYTNDSGTIAVTVDHPDPQYTLKAIQLSGVGGGPDISCTASIDFGVVGLGQTASRSASCTNDGNVPLRITAAGFEPGTTTELSAALMMNGGPATLPLTLQSGASLTIAMDFAPNAAGVHTTTFRVTSNDTDTPEATIAVEAEALMSNGCTVQVTPASLDFGAVPPGGSSDAVAVAANTGTGACAVNVLGLTSTTAPEFTLVNGPQSMNLGPGESFGVRVRFSPSAENSFSGGVELSTTDVTNPMPMIGLSGTGLSPFASVRALPSAIDFGQVQAGCTNPAMQQVTLQNNGPTAVDVTATLEAGTPAELGLTTPSPNPITIPSGGSADLMVSFLPGGPGTFNGRIQVAVAGGPTLYVPLEGEGIATPMSTVTFPGEPTPELDVLVVVDDSCSMTEEQQRLSAAGPILIARGDAAGAEYHIGVTTTDDTPAIAGTLRGSPSVVDWMSPTRDADLQANILQGTNGSPTEQGLYAGTRAVTDTTLLQGPNAGFLRPNAELVMIIISDEPDQSPDTVDAYLTSLSNRPTGAPGTPRIYTITGGLNGCTAAGTTAQPAPRYVDAATRTGGFDRSICLQTYDQILTEIADETFAPGRSRFPLGAAPVPGSVVVRVDGVQAPATDFGIDFVTNEVVFLPGAVPQLSQTVEVDYATQCVPATCGNSAPDSGEQCDDGNADNTDMCLDTCLDAYCGDTYVYAANEQCDDGNTISGDGCNAQCTIEGCGNGIPEPPEECDDGQNNSDTQPDACRTSCRDAYCGDNVTDTNEQCDDGNQVDTDACVACQDAFCGDGFVQQGVEECDDGNNVDTDACDNNCTSNLINFVVTSAAQTLTPAAGNPLAINDETVVPVTIGFPFDYLGVPQTTVRVSDNGFIAFEQTNATFSNAAIPSTNNPNSVIAFWWDDHDPGRPLTPAPEIRSEMTGTAPNRVRTITFENVPRYSPGGSQTGYFTAEVRLYETTNVVEVHYGTIVDTGNNTAWSASVGWESQGGTRGAAVLACTPSCTEADFPADTIYTYTPQ